MLKKIADTKVDFERETAKTINLKGNLYMAIFLVFWCVWYAIGSINWTFLSSCIGLVAIVHVFSLMENSRTKRALKRG